MLCECVFCACECVCRLQCLCLCACDAFMYHGAVKLEIFQLKGLYSATNTHTCQYVSTCEDPQ